MKFAEYNMIYCLWFVFLFAIFLLWSNKRKNRKRKKLVDKALFRDMTDHSSKRERWQTLLMVLVFVFTVLALMRPQWGFEWREIKREGLDIIVALDTSKSMLTDDVKPNRLTRSKYAVKDLIKKLQGDRIGLVAFAGTGFLVCPLTVDYHGFMLTLDDVSTNIIPRGGTSLASAINEAIRSYKDIKSKYKVMIIITDGEDLEGNVLEWAKKAKKEGIRIYCIGIGTKEGELIRVKNEKGEYGFLKDKNGNFVKSRLNETLLQKIALTTDGVYVRASGAQMGLDVIYERYISKLEKHEIKNKMERRYYERFQYPLAVGTLLLLVTTIYPLRKKIE